MRRITSIILAALMLAGCGSVEEEAPQQSPAAAAAEQTSQGEKGAPEETQTFVMTTVFGTTSVSKGADPNERAIESAKSTTTRKPLNTDVVEYTTSQENACGEMKDSADTFTQEFLGSVVSAEYMNFGGDLYLIEGDLLENVKKELSAYHGKVCEDPEVDGGYIFMLRDSGGNTHYVGLMSNYISFDGTFYNDPEYDSDGSRNYALAAYFRNYGKRVDENGNDIPPDKLNEMTAEFELVMLRPGGKSGYVVHDTYGLTSFSLKDGSLEQMPAGTMLKITWSGMIAEIYPGVLEGVKSVTRANNLANPDRPDFVTENLSALVEACRGKDDYSDEIEKLTGLKKCEKDALMWLVGNELFSETH